MSKIQYRIKDVKEFTKKDGQKMQVLETEQRVKESECKDCGKNPRNQGSSRCKECVNKYRASQYSNERLAKKVDEARKENEKIV